MARQDYGQEDFVKMHSVKRLRSIDSVVLGEFFDYSGYSGEKINENCSLPDEQNKAQYALFDAKPGAAFRNITVTEFAPGRSDRHNPAVVHRTHGIFRKKNSVSPTLDTWQASLKVTLS